MISASKDALSGDISKPLSNAKRDTRDAWDKVIDAKDELQNAASRAKTTVRGYIDTASDEISHASETVTTRIRSNPVQSSLIALGVGYILGRLFRL